MRRLRGRWMNKACDPVLEFLADHDIAVPIGVLDNELEPSYPTIDRATTKLEERGFIEKDDQYESFWRITDRGKGYLDGDVDASKFEHIEDGEE